jgi:hypothetical protein
MSDVLKVLLGALGGALLVLLLVLASPAAEGWATA